MNPDKFQKSLLAQGVIKKDIVSNTNIKDIAIQKIKVNPNQPRRRFDPDKLKELTESIKSAGILEPLIVRPKGEDFEIVAGERRYRAAQEALLDKIPCIIRELGDTEAFEISVIENIQRDDLDPIEEAMAYKYLMDFHGYTFREFNHAIGKSQGYINERIQLLSLPKSIRENAFALRTRTRHARHILKLENNEQLQEKIFHKIVNENLSHEETAELVSILNDSNVSEEVKSFVIESKELKPKVTRQVINIGFPENSTLKVMKNIARQSAGRNSKIDQNLIENIIQKEKDKINQKKESPKNAQMDYLSNLESHCKNLLLLLNDNIEIKSSDSFDIQKIDIIEKLREFISFIGNIEIGK